MREYKLFRRSKNHPIGEENEWIPTVEGTNFDCVSEVMRINAEDNELQDFEWKLVTIN